MKTNFDREAAAYDAKVEKKAGKRKERRRPGGESERQKAKTT